MRLFNLITNQVELVDEQLFAPDEDERCSRSQYIVISHRWIEEKKPLVKKEITFDDIKNIDVNELLADPQPEQSDSVAKFLGAREKVRHWSNNGHGQISGIPEQQALQTTAAAKPIEHFWIDTCCIDQNNAAELSMSINSMHRWYKRATTCFAYLYDFDINSGIQTFTESDWFKRGWTLQELVAPKCIEFFDKNWEYVGSKETLQDVIAARTGIDRSILQTTQDLHNPSVAHRMSWFRDRSTKMPEDAAYCLMGLFDVHMPTMYGEGLRSSFRRLQEEIVKYSDDHSILAWKQPQPQPVNGGHTAPPPPQQHHESGPFAKSPDCFTSAGPYKHHPNRHNSAPFHLTNKGLKIQLYLQNIPNSKDLYIAALDVKVDAQRNLGIYLRCLSTMTRQYCRTRISEFCLINHNSRGNLSEIYLRPPFPAAGV